MQMARARLRSEPTTGCRDGRAGGDESQARTPRAADGDAQRSAQAPSAQRGVGRPDRGAGEGVEKGREGDGHARAACDVRRGVSCQSHRVRVR